MGRLNAIGVKHGTDKSSICHDYLDFYENIFEEIGVIKDFISLLEIGIFKGSSIKMWKEYLPPNCKVIGLDINEVEDIPGCHLHKINAYGEDGLQLIKELKPNVIIDDGSHNSKDIIDLVNFLTEKENLHWFPSVFIYEDCHAAFFDQYTPSGTENAYYYCKDKFEELSFDVRIKQRFGTFSDSVTMVMIKK